MCLIRNARWALTGIVGACFFAWAIPCDGIKSNVVLSEEEMAEAIAGQMAPKNNSFCKSQRG